MHWSVAIVVAVIFMAGMTDSKPVAQKKGPPPPHDKAVEGGSDDEQGVSFVSVVLCQGDLPLVYLAF